MNLIKSANLFLKFIITSCAISLCLLSCGFSSDIAKHPAKRLENYAFVPGQSIDSRIQQIPEMLLKAWRKWDGKNFYKAYTPNEDEIKIIREAIAQLPPLTKQAMKERLVGLYFISDFMGLGVTDWILDKDNNVYTYIIINSDTLKKDISELLTWKENTCFVNDDPAYKIKVDVDLNKNGFLYILLHESAHAADYIFNLTPFTEPYFKKRQQRPNTSAETSFTANIWSDYNKSINEYPFRDAVSFYGISKPPSMKISDAPSIYKELNKSPFISLYGSLSWAEDLAEFLSFYHLTKKMSAHYRINLYRSGELLYSIEPVKNELVNSRFKNLDAFYALPRASK